MFKLNKTLIKKGFKSIFKTKLFSILMILMILLSSSTYTMLQSSSEALSKTYNNVMTEGKLADDLVKENFIVSNGSTLDIKMKNQNGNLIDINEANVKANQTVVSNIGSIEIYTVGTGDYNLSSYKKISYKLTQNTSFSDEIIQINNLVSQFKSDIKNDVKSKLALKYVSTLNDTYENKLIAKNTQSLSVSSNLDAFKIVNLGTTKNQNLDLNNLVIYDGTKYFTKEKTDQELKDEINARISRLPSGNQNLTINSSKGFKITAVNSAGSPSITVTDSSSFEAIVSPAYANSNGKISISHAELFNILKNNKNLMDDISQDKKDFRNKYKDNLVWIDKTPYFIIGIGITPDFIYPIIDEKHPTIDKNQAIIYVNNRGFQRIHDAFRSNPQENYVSIKYNSNLSPEELKGLKSELKSISRGGQNLPITHGSKGKKSISLPINAWPKNIEVLTSINDEEDQLLLVQERVGFLSDLRDTISTVSYATTTLLVIFSFSIIIMVFNVLLNINRKTFATMLALGYSKTQIAVSNAISAILLVGVPSALGYVFGYLLQFWFTGIFKDFWVIPNYGTSFSLISLIITAIIPLFTVGFLIMSVTFVQLRYSISNLLSESVDPSSGLLTNLISKAKYISIMTKYSLGLISKNLGKLILLTITSIIAITSLSIGMGTIGKASYAYEHTLGMSNYNFEVDLYTPTKEGGQYKRLNRSNLESMINTSDVSETYDKNGNPKFTLGKPHWHVPGVGDARYGLPNSAGSRSNIKNAQIYLRDMLQTKIFIDQNLAGGLNPWDTASKLMPENQRNIADEDAKKTESLNSNKTWDLADKINAFAKRLSSTDNDIPYIISYDNIILDDLDEEYTYVDATIDDSNSNNFHIKGINENTKMINNVSALLKQMNNSNDKFPIIIDKFIAKKYSLNKGSEINYVINNMSDRNLKINQGKNHIVKAKVFDIVDGYNSEGIYTTREKANTLLGLGNDGFNGVFSKSQNPTILQTLPLYSPSGIYAGTDSFYGPWDSTLSKMLKNWNHPEVATNLDEFKQTYSSTPYVSATSLVNWKEINKLTFKNISHLASTIIYIIEIISIILSILFTLIIAGLLLTSNKKKIATLWTLGYRKKEVIKVFLSMYILPIAIAFTIALPIAIGVLATLQLFVMNLGSVLIPFALSWWMPIIAIAAVSTIFILSTMIIVYSQSSDKALEAFKGD